MKNLLSTAQETLSGKKTYITGALMIIFALSGLALGNLGTDETIALVLNGIGLIGLRHGVEKSSPTK